jgi:hypothetical protein
MHQNIIAQEILTLISHYSTLKLNRLQSYTVCNKLARNSHGLATSFLDYGNLDDMKAIVAGQPVLFQSPFSPKSLLTATKNTKQR